MILKNVVTVKAAYCYHWLAAQYDHNSRVLFIRDYLIKIVGEWFHSVNVITLVWPKVITLSGFYYSACTNVKFFVIFVRSQSKTKQDTKSGLNDELEERKPLFLVTLLTLSWSEHSDQFFIVLN
jgi:hypothetical protein